MDVCGRFEAFQSDKAILSFGDSPPCAGGVSDWRLRPAGDVGGAGGCSSRVVTREESFISSGVSQRKAATIDWLNATFDTPFLSVSELMTEVGRLMSRSVSAYLDGGLFGFEERYRLESRLDDGVKVEVGSIALGGASQRGRWLLQLTGKGCGLVKDWPGIQALLHSLGATITRVDLAVDFLDGEYSVDDAMTLYHDGAFISRGRNPDLDIQGAWHEGGTKGRTLYVGKLKNGKTLCVYEKGRQLNMKDSNWTRYEVRLGNRDRVIPLDVLTNPDKYFVGAYPALADMLEAGAEEIPTLREEVKGSLAHSLRHAKRCYGKHIHQALQATDCDVSDLIEEIRVIGMPGRLDPAALTSGLDWQTLKSEIRREYA